MLSRSLAQSSTSFGLVRVAPGCVQRVQESVSKLFYSSQALQPPSDKQDSSSEASRDPFLAHLQQKTEKELCEILRKQQQQPTIESANGETKVSDCISIPAV